MTVNVSGQTAGTFNVGFATGTISGSGSSLVVGVSDMGSNGNNVSLTADLITELDLISYGRGNYIDLGDGVNDLQTLSVAGRANIYIDGLPTSVSAFTGTGAVGDITLGIDATSSTGNEQLASGAATLTGGGGFDTIRLDTGGTFAAQLQSFEGLYFDGSSATLDVYATGMNSVNTLTFSGINTTVPEIRG